VDPKIHAQECLYGYPISGFYKSLVTEKELQAEREEMDSGDEKVHIQKKIFFHWSNFFALFDHVFLH
jgi:hypothetical protein